MSDVLWVFHRSGKESLVVKKLGNKKGHWPEKESVGRLYFCLLFYPAFVVSGEYLIASTHCDSVLHREVNRSLEYEIVNAAVQYLMTVSCLSASLYCQHSARRCGLSLPACRSTVNNAPVEAQGKSMTLSNQIICCVIHRPKWPHGWHFCTMPVVTRGGFPIRPWATCTCLQLFTISPLAPRSCCTFRLLQWHETRFERQRYFYTAADITFYISV